MKNALITGSSGFLGRHFRKKLEDDGWGVTPVDIYHKANPMKRIDTRLMDARDFFRYYNKYDDSGGNNVDLVIHCAAVVGGRQVTSNEPLRQAVNLELDAALFQWALRARPGRVVYISSSAVYPWNLQRFSSKLRLQEVMAPMPLGKGLGRPDALYGHAKLNGEYLARLAQAEELQVTVVRPISGYGADQSEDYPFPAFVRRARASADPFDVWGDPMQVRDFIHVDDIVDGTLAVAESCFAHPVNLCTGRPTELGALARMICKEAGHQPGWIRTVKDKPMGVEWRVGDPAQMLEFYIPKVSLEEGIRRAFTD